jgi:hypothetical protein
VHGKPGIMTVAGAAAQAWSGAIASAAKSPGAAVEPKSLHAWNWNPIPNEELVIAMGCTEAPRACGIAVVRPPTGDAGAGDVLASLDCGKDLSDVARSVDARHLNVHSLDVRGLYSRAMTYLYGRVEIGESKRP